MSRRYGPVSTSIWESEKFLSLGSSEHRLGFIYILACKHSNALGVFSLPPSYIATDLRIETKAAEKMLEDLEAVGLIERSGYIVRVRSWFWNDSGSNSPSTGSMFCKHFRDTRVVKRSPIRSRALVEMLLSTFTRAEGWNPNTKQLEQFTTDADALLKVEVKADRKNLIDALISERDTVSDTVFNTVWDMVSYMVGDILELRIENREGEGELRRVNREGEREGGIQRGKPEKPEKGKNSPNEPANPVALEPLKGSRRPVADDVQQTIRELTARAKAK